MPIWLLAFSPWIVAAFVVWTIGGVLILADFYRMHQKRLRGESSPWHGSPLLWFSACAFPVGLMVALFSAPSLLYRFFGYWLTATFILVLLFMASGIIAVVRWDAQQVALQQEMRLRQQAASNPWAVAASKPVAHLTIVGTMIIGFIIIVFALLRIFSMYIHPYPLETSLIILAVAWLMLMAITIILSSAQKRFYKRLNARKSLLAAENRWIMPRELAVQEPLQTLMPPLVLRLKWMNIFCYLVFMAVYGWLLLDSMNVRNISSGAFQMLIYFPILLLYLLRDWGERVEATTQDLTVTRGIWFARQKQHLPWQEARLFVCYRSFNFFKGETTMTYELAGPARLVQWTRVINTRSLFMPWKPELSADEYNQQTQELCAFITRQTGLQLRDLSEEGLSTRSQEMLIRSQVRK